MERGRLPGTSLEVSRVGFGFDRRLPDDRYAAALVARASTLQVDLFDVSRAEDPAQAIRAIHAGAGGPSRRPTVLRGFPADAFRPGNDARRERSGLPGVEGRASGAREVPVILDPGVEDFGELGTLERLRSWARSAGLAEVGASWRSPAVAAEAMPAALASGVRLLAWPLHLLGLGELDRCAPEIVRRGAGVLALDPHASGRLDGSRLSQSPLETSPRAGPVTLEELQREFAPVARLGFLTSGHRRSLGQAAVRGLLDLPGVVGVLPRFRSVREVDEFADVGAVPPLDPGELRRVRAPAGP